MGEVEGFIFIRVYVLPQERDFAVPGVEQICCFLNDGLWITASLASTGKGHHTERAHIVATPHDGNERRYAIGIEAHRADVRIGLLARQQYIDGPRTFVDFF